MIAHESLDLFDPVLAHLPRLVPSDVIPAPDLPPAADEAFLHPDAHPADLDRAVIVAVIDHAIPFAHPLFRTESGRSRMAAIWLMEAPATEARADLAFGRELRGGVIDALADPGDPLAAYRAAGLMAPGRCMAMAAASSHGAAVAALAAGHDPDDPAGRDHPVLAVSLPRAALAETSGSVAALFIQAAVIFVIARARALAREMSARAGRRVRPAVVLNLSLGVTAGADDGSLLLTRLQDAIADRTGDDLGLVHVVLPTGNNRQDRLRGHLMSGQGVGWQIPPGDPTPNAVEIWAAPGEAAPVLRVTAPSGATGEVGLTATGSGWLCDGQGRRLVRAVLQRRGGRRACLTLILPPTLPADDMAEADRGAGLPGLWHLHLVEGGPSGCTLAIHRDDRLPGFRAQGRQSRLVDPAHALRDDDGGWPGADPDPAPGPIRRNGSASAYARGRRQIRVGATTIRPEARLSPYCGLLPDGRAGDVTAPADRSAARQGMVLPGIAPAAWQRLSGTSLSAPQITRWLARALSQGADIPDRDALRRALAAGQAAAPVPDAGLPDLPWRDGLSD